MLGSTYVGGHAQKSLHDRKFEMRKINQEISDKIIIEEILNNSNICRIGISDNGIPYVLPFNYGYNDNQIFIHCALTGIKIDL